MKKQILVCVEFLFWVAVLAFFSVNSVLRPILTFPLEAITVLLIITSIYLNKLILIPKVLLKRNYGLYIVLSMAIVFVISSMEFCMTHPFIIKQYSRVFSKDILISYCSNTCVYIFLRNATFFVFFLILFLCRRFRDLMKQEHAAMVAKANRFAILLSNNKLLSIGINKIRYFHCFKNITYIELKNGQHYKQFISLKELEQELTESRCLRVNRSHLVLYENIDYYTSTELYLCGISTPIPYYDTKPQIVLDKLLCWNKSKFHETHVIKESIGDTLAGLNSVSFDENPEFGGIEDSCFEEKWKPERKNDQTHTVLNFIQLRTLCKTQEIVHGTQLSARTVERAIQTLKMEGKIVYVGSKRYGGYHVAEDVLNK